jgi:hypothetical protein
VDVCRCGAERKRLEALGYNFDLSPMATTPSSASRRVSGAAPGLAGLLVGYRSAEDVSTIWRIVFTLLCLIMVGGAGYAVVTYTHLPLQPIRANVEIVRTLEEHTRTADSGGNAITSFLGLPGTTAVLEPTMTADDQLKPLSDADLQTGFCSVSLARQIRYQFPGFYEGWADERLERVALEKYPEFQDRLCVLPTSLGVSPDDVVKYRLRDRTIVEWALVWSRTALITGLFAMVLLNVYYRLLVDRLPAKAA